MTITQIIKRLNSTEVGDGNTNDSYLLIPAESELERVLPEVNKVTDFIDQRNGKRYSLKFVSGREKRISGLGQFFRDNDVKAGDKVILERLDDSGDSKYFISNEKYSDIIVFKKTKNLFISMNEDRHNSILMDNADIRVELVRREKKRADSPDETNFYDIFLNGVSLTDKFKNDDKLILKRTCNSLTIEKFYSWKKYVLNTEE